MIQEKSHFVCKWLIQIRLGVTIHLLTEKIDNVKIILRACYNRLVERRNCDIYFSNCRNVVSYL